MLTLVAMAMAMAIVVPVNSFQFSAYLKLFSQFFLLKIKSSNRLISICLLLSALSRNSLQAQMVLRQISRNDLSNLKEFGVILPMKDSFSWFFMIFHGFLRLLKKVENMSSISCLYSLNSGTVRTALPTSLSPECRK